jgi:hypothetical protein
MGSISSRLPKAKDRSQDSTAPRHSTGPDRSTGASPVITALQTILLNNGRIDHGGVSGVYDQKTHDAISAWLDSLKYTDEPRAKNISIILDWFTRKGVDYLQKNPDEIADRIFQLQTAFYQRPSPVKEQGTIFSEVTLPNGTQAKMPLTMVWQRGWPMYLALLEQYNLVTRTLPYEQRLNQLALATRAIADSLLEDPRNQNLASAIIKADADLREHWSLQEKQHTQSVPGKTLISTLEDWIPELSSASSNDKLRIINHIYSSFPYAETFMETPPNINSQITDIGAVRRNRASLTSSVQTFWDRLRGI